MVPTLLKSSALRGYPNERVVHSDNRIDKYAMKTLSLCSLLPLFMALPLAANVIANPGFESGSGSTSSSALGNFSAPVTSWGAWNNSPVLTSLEVLPSTLPLADAGGQMLHISSTGEANGIYQIFSSGSLYAGAWFFVNSGLANLWMVDGPGGGRARAQRMVSGNTSSSAFPSAPANSPFTPALVEETFSSIW